MTAQILFKFRSNFCGFSYSPPLAILMAPYTNENIDVIIFTAIKETGTLKIWS